MLLNIAKEGSGKSNHQLCKVSRGTRRKRKRSWPWTYSSQTTALGLRNCSGGVQSSSSSPAKSQQKILTFLTGPSLQQQLQHKHNMLTSGWEIGNGLWQSFVRTAASVKGTSCGIAYLLPKVMKQMLLCLMQDYFFLEPVNYKAIYKIRWETVNYIPFFLKYIKNKMQ